MCPVVITWYKEKTLKICFMCDDGDICSLRFLNFWKTCKFILIHKSNKRAKVYDVRIVIIKIPAV